MDFLLDWEAFKLLILEYTQWIEFPELTDKVYLPGVKAFAIICICCKPEWKGRSQTEAGIACSELSAWETALHKRFRLNCAPVLKCLGNSEVGRDDNIELLARVFPKTGANRYFVLIL